MRRKGADDLKQINTDYIYNSKVLLLQQFFDMGTDQEPSSARGGGCTVGRVGRVAEMLPAAGPEVPCLHCVREVSLPATL